MKKSINITLNFLKRLCVGETNSIETLVTGLIIVVIVFVVLCHFDPSILSKY